MDKDERPEFTPERKKEQLYWRQKKLLDKFLSTGAISAAQYRKSLGDLTIKMGMTEKLHEDID